MKKILLFFLLTIMIVGGCQNDDFYENRHDDRQFLSLPANTDFSSLEDSDMDIIKLAIGRIRIIANEDGKLSAYPQHAAEANNIPVL
ncbi:MAG: hypothetical protein K2K98_12160 [Muribaculaceae bacterium]|nr:hypothetical protein [Muribaculaceae bacterium]